MIKYGGAKLSPKEAAKNILYGALCNWQEQATNDIDELDVPPSDKERAEIERHIGQLCDRVARILLPRGS